MCGKLLLPFCDVLNGVNVVGVAFAGYFGDQCGALSNQRTRTLVTIDGKMRPQLGMNAHGVASFTAIRRDGQRSLRLGDRTPR